MSPMKVTFHVDYRGNNRKTQMEGKSDTVPYKHMIEELQEKLRISEEGRRSLQQKFDVMMQTYKIKEHARYNALRRRYGTFLEEDQRRQQRNENLLQMLERIDSRTANMAARTERLALLRKHYEQYLGRVYPSWRIPGMSQRMSQVPPVNIREYRDEDVSGYGTHTGSSGYVRETASYEEPPRMPPMSTPRSNTHLYKMDHILPDKYKIPRVEFDMPSVSVIKPTEERRTMASEERSPPINARYEFKEATPSRSMMHDLSPRESRNRMQDLSPRERTRREPAYLSQPEYEQDQNTSGDILNMSLSDDGVPSLTRSDTDTRARHQHWDTLRQAYINRTQQPGGFRQDQSPAINQSPRETAWQRHQEIPPESYNVHFTENEEPPYQHHAEQDGTERESFRDKIRRLKVMIQENKELEHSTDTPYENVNNTQRHEQWERPNANGDVSSQQEGRRKSEFDTQSSQNPQSNEMVSWQDQRVAPNTREYVQNQDTVPGERKMTERRMSTISIEQNPKELPIEARENIAEQQWVEEINATENEPKTRQKRQALSDNIIDQNSSITPAPEQRIDTSNSEHENLSVQHIYEQPNNGYEKQSGDSEQYYGSNIEKRRDEQTNHSVQQALHPGEQRTELDENQNESKIHEIHEPQDSRRVEEREYPEQQPSQEYKFEEQRTSFGEDSQHYYDQNQGYGEPQQSTYEANQNYDNTQSQNYQYNQDNAPYEYNQDYQNQNQPDQYYQQQQDGTVGGQNDQQYYQDNSFYPQQDPSTEYDQNQPYQQEGYGDQYNNQDSGQKYVGDYGWTQEQNQQQSESSGQSVPQQEQYNQEYYNPQNQYEYSQRDPAESYSEGQRQEEVDLNRSEGQVDQTREEESNKYYADISEESTQDSDSRSREFQIGHGQQSPSQRSVDRYRTMLGVDPNSDPAYSEVDEIEEEMAAVVASGTGGVQTQPQDTAIASSIPINPSTSNAPSENQNRPKPTEMNPAKLQDDSSDFDYSSGM